MATILTHAGAAAAMGVVYADRPMPRKFWDLTLLCSILPDADVIGFRFGVHYGDFLGHRGFTHSLAFAGLTGLSAAYFGFPEEHKAAGRFWKLAAFFTAVTASHGLLDMLTDGGLGVAIFSPFNTSRYFFPWNPIRVSPIGLHGIFTRNSLEILKSEALWVWLPFWTVAGAVMLWRRGLLPDRSLPKS